MLVEEFGKFERICRSKLSMAATLKFKLQERGRPRRGVEMKELPLLFVQGGNRERGH